MTQMAMTQNFVRVATDDTEWDYLEYKQFKEEKTIKARAEKEDFIPNFVNPFRNSEQGFAPADNQNLADKDTE